MGKTLTMCSPGCAWPSLQKSRDKLFLNNSEDHPGLLEQFRRHGQVDLRVRQANMSQIDGEMVHQSSHISSLMVPCGQAVDRKGVAILLSGKVNGQTMSSLCPFMGKSQEPLGISENLIADSPEVEHDHS